MNGPNKDVSIQGGVEMIDQSNQNAVSVANQSQQMQVEQVTRSMEAKQSMQGKSIQNVVMQDAQSLQVGPGVNDFVDMSIQNQVDNVAHSIQVGPDMTEKRIGEHQSFKDQSMMGVPEQVDGYAQNVASMRQQSI